MERLLFIIGTSLKGVASCQERIGITTLIDNAVTAPKYKLFLIEERWSALVLDKVEGNAITGELVKVTDEKYREIVDTEPDSIQLELIELEDGSRVRGAVTDIKWLKANAKDITAYGGYKKYLLSRNSVK